MNKIFYYLLFILFFNNAFSQGGYGILGYRFNNLQSQVQNKYFENGFDDWLYTYDITKISINKRSIVLGLGYQWINKESKYLNLLNPIYNIYTTWDFSSFNYNGFKIDDGYYSSRYEFSDKISNIDWNLGVGYGFRLSNSLTLLTQLEYTFAGIDDYNFSLPSNNYFSINFKFGFGTSTKLGHVGIYGNYYPRRYFINKDGPKLDSYDVEAQIPITIVYWATIVLGALSGEDVSGDFGDKNSSTYSGSLKACHVFGKIRFVEYGEDYKVRFVDFGEDLKIRYVGYGANSPGQWDVVEYGEKFKIKIVDYGEDFTVREVSFGEGCK